MNFVNTVFAGLTLCMWLNAAQATTISQHFHSSWTISTWDYYGDVAALEWHYIPYQPFDSSLGTLEKVTITTTFAGVKDPADTLGIRYALFTGWDPDQYQFYDAPYIYPGSSTFSDTRSFSSDADFALSNFTDYKYLPQAFYYFESRTATTHHIDADTVLTYEYADVSNVPEPTTFSLVLLGVAAIGAGGFRTRKPAVIPRR